MLVNLLTEFGVNFLVLCSLRNPEAEGVTQHIKVLHTTIFILCVSIKVLSPINYNIKIKIEDCRVGSRKLFSPNI